MIHRIYSTLPTFKELNFQPGFNAIVAEKTDGARKEQTRNAAGKSSILEIIHYLLGASSPKDGLFAKDVFDGHSFGMVFDLSGHTLNVERPAGSQANRSNFLFHGDIPEFVRNEMGEDVLFEGRPVKLRTWNEILGREAFGIAGNNGKFTPSFRLAFPYFCRLDAEGGISDAFESWKKQPVWQRDVTIAFLLGLDWHVLSKMEALRIEEQHLDQLKKELHGSGVVGQLIGKSSGLRGQLAIAEDRVRKFEQRLQDFQILPEYREVEREASDIARKIGDFANANTLDRRLMADLREALEAEKEPLQSDLERLYAAAGVQLPGATLRRLESVKEFHRTVIQNRKAHLGTEISAAEKRIADRESVSQKLQTRQAELMGLLRTHGALDQYNKLQEELSRLRSQTELLKRQHELAQKIERGGADLEIQRAKLHQNLINDLDERANRLDEAILLYAELSREVSERSSVLEVQPTKSGLKLAITGGPSKSKGIREQQIFCFDMLLAVLQAKRSKSLGFLVHDSHLFDAMDERQVANAIEAGVRLSEQYGFQYIITMNSDRIPYGDFTEGFNFESYIMEPRLTDETETGGLFGIRF